MWIVSFGLPVSTMYEQFFFVFFQFLKEMAILAKMMQWEVPLANFPPKEFSRHSPLCFIRNPQNSVSLYKHRDLPVWNSSHTYSLSRTFGSEMLLSFLVTSPEKRDFRFGVKTWRLGMDSEIDGRKETSLQLSGFVSIWKLGSCQKGEPPQGSVWCSVAQILQVAELMHQECKLKCIFSTTALRKHEIVL